MSPFRTTWPGAPSSACPGATGMAGGDHLHFAVLVHGVFVNPVEWWDPHWIRDNVELKRK